MVSARKHSAPIRKIQHSRSRSVPPNEPLQSFVCPLRQLRFPLLGQQPFSGQLSVCVCVRVRLGFFSASLSLLFFVCLPLSLTRRSQGVVRFRTEGENRTRQLILRSSRGLVPCDREDCRSSVSGQCKTQEFSSLLQ